MFLRIEGYYLHYFAGGIHYLSSLVMGDYCVLHEWHLLRICNVHFGNVDLHYYLKVSVSF